MAKKKLNVAMIGYDFMGRAHSNAWRQVARFMPDLPFDPVMKVVAGRTEAKVKEAAERLGWEEYATSWCHVPRYLFRHALCACPLLHPPPLRKGGSHGGTVFTKRVASYGKQH